MPEAVHRASRFGGDLCDYRGLDARHSGGQGRSFTGLSYYHRYRPVSRSDRTNTRRQSECYDSPAPLHAGQAGVSYFARILSPRQVPRFSCHPCSAPGHGRQSRFFSGEAGIRWFKSRSRPSRSTFRIYIQQLRLSAPHIPGSRPLFLNEFVAVSRFRRSAILWLHNAMDLIGRKVFQHLARAAGPAYFQLFHGLEYAEPEMRSRISRSSVACARRDNVILAVAVLGGYLELGSNGHAVALGAHQLKSYPVIGV